MDKQKPLKSMISEAFVVTRLGFISKGVKSVVSVR